MGIFESLIYKQGPGVYAKSLSAQHLFHSRFNSYLCVNNLKLIVTLIFLFNYLILSMSSYITISFGMKRFFFCSFIVFIIENKLVIDETKTGISLCKHVVCFCSPSCFHMTWYRNEGRERKMKMRRVSQVPKHLPLNIILTNEYFTLYRRKFETAELVHTLSEGTWWSCMVRLTSLLLRTERSDHPFPL